MSNARFSYIDARIHWPVNRDNIEPEGKTNSLFGWPDQLIWRSCGCTKVMFETHHYVANSSFYSEWSFTV